MLCLCGEETAAGDIIGGGGTICPICSVHVDAVFAYCFFPCVMMDGAVVCSCWMRCWALLNSEHRQCCMRVVICIALLHQISTTSICMPSLHIYCIIVTYLHASR